jgi:hypothetical protein
MGVKYRTCWTLSFSIIIKRVKLYNLTSPPAVPVDLFADAMDDVIHHLCNSSYPQYLSGYCASLALKTLLLGAEAPMGQVNQFLS